MSISDSYILPAINKMEKLSTVTGGEWSRESQAFTHWCKEAVGKIEKMARDASDEMEPNMAARVLYLEGCAIKAEAASGR